jgi:hypothetical protein
VVEPLPLVRDVLDKQIYDANGLKVGKVDGIILVPRQHRPPRVEAIEIHMPTLWRRVARRLGDWLESWQQRLAPAIAGATRIRFDHIAGTGIDVVVDIDARRTNAFAWETWLAEHFVERIPGGSARGAKE